MICRKTKKSSFKNSQVRWGMLPERDNYDRKISASKQRTDIGKHSFVNRKIKLWNQLPAETLVTFLCKSHIFIKRVREVIIIEEK